MGLFGTLEKKSIIENAVIEKLLENKTDDLYKMLSVVEQNGFSSKTIDKVREHFVNCLVSEGQESPDNKESYFIRAILQNASREKPTDVESLLREKPEDVKNYLIKALEELSKFETMYSKEKILDNLTSYAVEKEDCSLLIAISNYYLKDNNLIKAEDVALLVNDSSVEGYSHLLSDIVEKSYQDGKKDGANYDVITEQIRIVQRCGSKLSDQKQQIDRKLAELHVRAARAASDNKNAQKFHYKEAIVTLKKEEESFEKEEKSVGDKKTVFSRIKAYYDAKQEKKNEEQRKNETALKSLSGIFITTDALKNIVSSCVGSSGNSDIQETCLSKIDELINPLLECRRVNGIKLDTDNAVATALYEALDKLSLQNEGERNFVEIALSHNVFQNATNEIKQKINLKELSLASYENDTTLLNQKVEVAFKNLQSLGGTKAVETAANSLLMTSDTDKNQWSADYVEKIVEQLKKYNKTEKKLISDFSKIAVENLLKGTNRSDDVVSRAMFSCQNIDNFADVIVECCRDKTDVNAGILYTCAQMSNQSKMSSQQTDKLCKAYFDCVNRYGENAKDEQISDDQYKKDIEAASWLQDPKDQLEEITIKLGYEENPSQNLLKQCLKALVKAKADCCYCCAVLERVDVSKDFTIEELKDIQEILEKESEVILSGRDGHELVFFVLQNFVKLSDLYREQGDKASQYACLKDGLELLKQTSNSIKKLSSDDKDVCAEKYFNALKNVSGQLGKGEIGYLKECLALISADLYQQFYEYVFHENKMSLENANKKLFNEKFHEMLSEVRTLPQNVQEKTQEKNRQILEYYAANILKDAKSFLARIPILRAFSKFEKRKKLYLSLADSCGLKDGALLYLQKSLKNKK